MPKRGGEFGTFGTTGDRGHDEFLRRLDSRIATLEAAPASSSKASSPSSTVQQSGIVVEVKASDGSYDAFVPAIEIDASGFGVSAAGSAAYVTLAVTAVTPGNYRFPSLIVDANGRITSAAENPLNYCVRAAECATTGVLPACTYANGTAGVGATLTATANGALGAIDGFTMLIQAGILVKDQASALQNGHYTITQLGDASHPWILTRTPGIDVSHSYRDMVVRVSYGTANVGTHWNCTAFDPIIGTDPLNWTP